MFFQRCCALVLGLCLVSAVSAQTVRFDTNVGTFDMVLNPTGNVNLQEHVDNLLAYVEAGRYDGMLLNRAQEGFVLQMGGFIANTLSLPGSFSNFNSVRTFDPVIVDADGDDTIDFVTTGLSNTRGTISLALSDGDLNSGTSSFFVNVVDNTDSLDSEGFVPFAEISDMATIDLIMNLPKASLPNFGVAGSNIPTLDGIGLVFAEQVFVLGEAVEEAALVFSGGDSPPPAAANATVPEPSALLLAAIGFLGATATRRRIR